MMKVDRTERLDIVEICQHWWVNEDEKVNCLDLAEQLSNEKPFRVDKMLSEMNKRFKTISFPDTDSDHNMAAEEDHMVQRTPPQNRGPPPPRSLSHGDIG